MEMEGVLLSNDEQLTLMREALLDAREIESLKEAIFTVPVACGLFLFRALALQDSRKGGDNV